MANPTPAKPGPNANPAAKAVEPKSRGGKRGIAPQSVFIGGDEAKTEVRFHVSALKKGAIQQEHTFNKAEVTAFSSGGPNPQTMFLKKDGSWLTKEDAEKVISRDFVWHVGSELATAEQVANKTATKLYGSLKASKTGGTGTGRAKRAPAAKTLEKEMREAFNISGVGSRLPYIPSPDTIEAWQLAYDALTSILEAPTELGQQELNYLAGIPALRDAGGKLKVQPYAGLVTILHDGIKAYTWLQEQGKTREDIPAVSGRVKVEMRKALPKPKSSAQIIAAAKAMAKAVGAE